tara:strand:+ start:1 stop:1413 length:1413 start_codon:yes stop_codon:yes gene_type:complete
MKELLEHIKETKWYKQAADIKMYFITMPCRAAANQLEAKTAVWIYQKMKYLEWISPKDSFNSKAKDAIAKQKQDPSFITKFMKLHEEKITNLRKKYEELKNKNIKEFSITKISKTLQELDKLTYDYWLQAFFSDNFDPEGDNYLKEEIQKYGVKLTEEEVNLFMRTNWKNYMQEERISLLNIALKGKNNEDINELLEKHAKKYFFIDNSWEKTKVLTVEDFKQRLQEVLNEDIETEIKELETNWEEKQQKYNLPEELLRVFQLYQQLFIIRDKRKNIVLLMNHVYDQLMLRAAELLQIPFEDLNPILAEEITPEVTTEEIKKKIEERRELSVESYTNNKSSFYYGEKAKIIHQTFKEVLAHKEEIIKGTTACPGIVKGIVRIIRGEVHFSKFNDGEILVAPMTRPEYVPLMKKAAAIITDEGGVTCHAAVVSRELKIPCVIGTQVATSKLMDGELVEVDADKGTVKVIEN